MIRESARLKDVRSDIRGPLYEEALRMEAAGTKVLKLNTGNPGKFGFEMPESVRRSLAERMEEAVPYCDVRGMKTAREAIAAYHTSRGLRNVTPDSVFIGNGVSEVSSMIMTALVGEGDEVLLPSPCYSLWSNNTRLCGAVPVFYRCDPENGWDPDTDDIRAKVTPRTKAILIINPNNPTGAVYAKKTLLNIAEIARKNGLVILSDEIYDRLVMDGAPFYSIAALAPDVPTVTFNGLSKSHIVCGFRCGWMVFSAPGDELDRVAEGVMKLASMRLCANALTQLVIPDALRDRASTDAMIVPGGRLYEQRKAALDVLSAIDGLTCVPNRAAMYVFPGIDRGAFDFSDDGDLAMRFLHEKHVLVIPGRGFEWNEDLRFRVVMLPEAKELTSAMEQLKDFLDSHRK